MTTPSSVVVSISNPDSDDVKITKTAKFCRDHVRRSAMAIIECGRELALLKSALREDDQRWRTAFGEDRDRKQIADNPFPFTSGTADRLIQIHARLSAGPMGPASQLPASWRTLYELSKLSDKQLESAKDKIHPMMTRSEAVNLRSRKKSKPRPPAERALNRAHDFYVKLPKEDFLREVVALMRDRGIDIDALQKAWEDAE